MLRVEGLPDSPLDAARVFHDDYLPQVRGNPEGADLIVVCFPLAGHQHRTWRLAVIQELAREVAPARANAVTGADSAALDETLDFLAHAPGVTGQILAVDGNPGKNS